MNEDYQSEIQPGGNKWPLKKIMILTAVFIFVALFFAACV